MRAAFLAPTLCLALVLGGCDPAADGGPGSDGDDGPVVVDGDDTGAEGALNLRPLCVENLTAAAPEVAPELIAWAEGMFASRNRFFGEATLLEFEAMGEDNLGDTPFEAITNRVERAWHRLRVQDIDGAIADLEIAVAEADADAPMLRGPARNLLAVAWMRKAELENCVACGNGEACLAPFSEEAQHQLTEGMDNAGIHLTDYLTEDEPDRLVPRWLLNVTHMALGTYPEGVPSQWLVDPERLLSEVEEPEWPNIGPALFLPGEGIQVPTLAGGVSLDDFDGDGLLDIMVSSFSPDDPMQLFLNTGRGFCDASDASGVSAITGPLSFSPADYDNDGDLDVAVPRGAWMNNQGNVRMSLLRNDGEGRFVDVAVEAGLADTVGPSQVAEWADADLDGDLDLFVGREALAGNNVAPSSMYVQEAPGVFVDRAVQFGLDQPGFVKGASWGDADNDGDPDLYVSTFGSDNRLYRNEMSPPFTEVGGPLGVQSPRQGFAGWWTDHDQDGDLDIFVAAYPTIYGSATWISPAYGRSAEPYVADLLGEPHDHETAKLYHNDVNVGFADVTADVGLDDVHATMGANFGDMDADGFPDIYLGTGAPSYDALEPNVAYLNDGGHTYHDITSDARVGHLQKGHGVAFADLDEDGDEDLYAQVGGAYPGDRFQDALFLNPRTGVTALTLRLQGVVANRSAIGARVRVVTGSRTIHKLVGTGGSFGANSLQVEVALGADEAIERVEIDWPASVSETVQGIRPGSVYVIREGDGVIDSWAFRGLDFPEEPLETDEQGDLGDP